jgi:hypothetical protein
VIDFGRAFETAWQRMTIILFQPLDLGKWGLLGFNAFLALLAEGGVSFNNPIQTSRQTTIQTAGAIPQVLHQFKQLTSWLQELPSDPWLMAYLCLGGALLVIWLVLTWVGCRGEFVFLDNIVRNRAALAVPWQRYARQGNIWFAFHMGLMVLTTLAVATTVGALLALNWSWISAERGPSGAEIGALILSALVIVVLGLIVAIVNFLIRSLVLPLYFKQTMGLGEALLAVGHLVVTRPLSLFVYMVFSFVISLVAAFIACLICVVAFCATCGLVLSVSCFPFIGTLLMSLVVCQLFLPILVFKRCFQLGCLEQFGPRYDVFSVDVQAG